MRKLFLFLFALLLFSGCGEWAMQPHPGGFPEPTIEPKLVDALIDTVTALTVANSASVPANPYAYPIGVGLAGLIGILEALRRKEKSARKFAENNNHASGKT